MPVTGLQREVEQKPAARPCCGNVRMNVMAIPPPYCRRRTGEQPAAKLRPVAIIAREEFVAAIAGQRDRHMFSSHPADMVRRNDRGIAEWFFHRTCYVVDCCLDIRLDNQLVVLGVKVLGNRTGMARLLEVLIGKADGQRLYAL